MPILLSKLRRSLSTLRRSLNVAVGRDLFIRPAVEADTEFHGTVYGGWAVIKGSISATSTIYSFGVGEDASFDQSLIECYGCTCHAFDPTPKSIAWVQRNIHTSQFVFHPWALADSDGTLRLYPPKNPSHVSASLFKLSDKNGEYFDAECYTLQNIMARLGHESVSVLKMDIEGAEYPVIANLIETGAIDRIDQLLIEFHHWQPEIGIDPTQKALASLEAAGLKVHWVSKGGYEVLFRRPNAKSGV